MFLSTGSEAYLEGELLVEDRVEGLPVDFGLKLLLFVRQQVDLYVWVRRAAHVHSRQLRRLDDPHHELMEEVTQVMSVTISWLKTRREILLSECFSHMFLDITCNHSFVTLL